jgi:hypothetical protein
VPFTRSLPSALEGGTPFFGDGPTAADPVPPACQRVLRQCPGVGSRRPRRRSPGARDRGAVARAPRNRAAARARPSGADALLLEIGAETSQCPLEAHAWPRFKKSAGARNAYWRSEIYVNGLLSPLAAGAGSRRTQRRATRPRPSSGPAEVRDQELQGRTDALVTALQHPTRLAVL